MHVKGNKNEVSAEGSDYGARRHVLLSMQWVLCPVSKHMLD